MQERSPILSVAVGVLLVALPLLYHRVESIFANELASCATLLFAAVIAGGLLCSLLVRSGATPRYARATAGDLAAGLFLLWGVVGICVTGSAEVDAFLWYRWGAVAACYWLVRTMVYRRVLLAGAHHGVQARAAVRLASTTRPAAISGLPSRHFLRRRAWCPPAYGLNFTFGCCT